ncbi:MAG: hypothetical protein IJ506_04475 [Clostridia bacterium]|nr:hypothetical protein [Clostridia bacterium]
MKAKMKKFLLLILTVLMTVFAGVFVSACGEEELGTLKASKILYDGTTITWSKVKGAKEYEVIINDGTPDVIEETQVRRRAGNASELKVSIRPIGKEAEGKAVTRTFTRLDTIETVEFDENGVMSWEENAEADAYVLQIEKKGAETKLITVNDTQYDAFEYDGISTKISVRPITSDGSTFSSFSDTVEKFFLATISADTITYDGEKIRWRGQGNVSGYEIRIDGATLETVPATKTLLEFDAKNSDFDVEIIAVGDGNKSFTGEPSEKKTFEFLDIIDDYEVVNGYLTWGAVEEADRYSILINGEEKTTEETQYALPTGAPLRIQIKPVMDEGNVYFSAYSEETTVTVLSTPIVHWNDRYPLIDGDPAAAFYWDPVTSAGSYQVQLILPNGQPADLEPTVGAKPEFDYAYTEPGTYKVSVQALPENTDNVYPSCFSTEYTIERLKAPTQVNQNFVESDPTDNSKFKVRWQYVSGASGYQIWKEDDAVSGLKTNSMNDTTKTVAMGVEDLSQAAGINYSIQALGKVDHEQRKIVLSSLVADNLKFTIHVLPTPSTPTISDGETTMSWNPVDGANGYAIQGTGAKVPPQKSETSYNLNELSEGEHALKVCATGNGSTTLASNYTPIVNVQRLAAPQEIKVNTRNGGEGQWSWTSVENAHGYILAYEGVTDPTVVNIGADVAGKIQVSGTTVAVSSNANYWSSGTYYLSSAFSTAKQFTKLKMPSFGTIVVDKYNLQWSDIPNAIGYNLFDQNKSSYDIYVDQAVYTLNSTKFPNTKLSDNQYTFRVQAIGDGNSYINSDISEAVARIEILPSPKVTKTGTAYVWETTDSDTQFYNVNIASDNNRVEKAKEGEVNSFSDFAKYFEGKMWNTNYEVLVTAKGYENGGTNSDGYVVIDSYPTTIQQYVKRLESPTVSYEYQVNGVKATQYDPNGKIVLSITKQSANANGYYFNIGDQHFEDATSLVWDQFMPTPGGTYDLWAYARGGNFDADGNYYINSAQASPSTPTITVLETVTFSSSPVNTDKTRITWNQHGSAKYFTIKLYFGDSDVRIISTKDLTTSKPNLTNSDLVSYGITDKTIADVTKVEVCACGGVSSVIDSEYSKPQEI